MIANCSGVSSLRHSASVRAMGYCLLVMANSLSVASAFHLRPVIGKARNHKPIPDAMLSTDLDPRTSALAFSAAARRSRCGPDAAQMQQVVRHIALLFLVRGSGVADCDATMPEQRFIGRGPLGSIMRVATGLVTLFFAGAALAQSYPDKPVRIVVGFA